MRIIRIILILMKIRCLVKINKLKNISSLNKDITSAFDKIETGYQEKIKRK